MFKHVLIPTDGTPLSGQAVDKGLAFARDAGAKATVLTVIEPYHLLSADPEQLADTRDRYEAHARAQAEAVLAAARDVARSHGVAVETVAVEHEHPYQAIIEVAEKRGCDLVAMASHGRRGIGALVLGSETVKVLTHAGIPVLVYR